MPSKVELKALPFSLKVPADVLLSFRRRTVALRPFSVRSGMALMSRVLLLLFAALNCSCTYIFSARTEAPPVSITSPIHFVIHSPPKFMVWTDEDNLANAIAFTLFGLVGVVLVSTGHSLDPDVAVEYHLLDPAQQVGSALLQSLHTHIGAGLLKAPFQMDLWYDPAELRRYFGQGTVLETLNESWGLSVSEGDRLHVFLHLRARLVDLAHQKEIWADTCAYERMDRQRDPVLEDYYALDGGLLKDKLAEAQLSCSSHILTTLSAYLAQTAQ